MGNFLVQIILRMARTGLQRSINTESSTAGGCCSDCKKTRIVKAVQIKGFVAFLHGDKWIIFFLGLISRFNTSVIIRINKKRNTSPLFEAIC
jgi:hypothetical protein